MDRGMVGFVAAFVVLALFGLLLGNYDTIKPAVAAAELSNATGAEGALVINKGLSMLLKFVLGGVFSGIALFVYSEAKSAYRLWKKNQQTRRWQPGPNAQWKPPQQQPRLTKNDLMFMSLLGRLPNRQNMSLDRRQMPEQQDESDLDIDLS